MGNAIAMIITAPEYQFPEGLSVNACLIAVDNIRWQVRCLYNVNMACECKLAHSKALTRYTCVSLKLRGYTATDIASGPMWMMPTVRTTVP